MSARSTGGPARRLAPASVIPVLAALCVSAAVSACDGESVPAADTQSAEGPQVEAFRLDNGMDVIVIPDHRAPVVTHMVWYRAGAVDEPPGKSGIAHFLEHLMFKGTAKIPPGEFSRIVARNGGRDNAFTSQDYTAYVQQVARDRLPLVMEMEADRMTGLTLSGDLVSPERDVVLEERRSRVDNRPLAVLGEKMQAALHGAHPYGLPVIGLEEDIRALDGGDALAFYRRHYDPGNAALVVAGDITAAQLMPLARRFYGAVPTSALPSPRRPAAPGFTGPRRVVHRDAGVRQPMLQRLYMADGYVTGGARTGAAIDVLSDILGGGTTSRLYRALVADGALAADAGAWAVTRIHGPGRIGMYAVPRAGVSLEALEAALDGVAARVREQGVTPEELARSQRALVARTIYARDDQQEMARIFGAAWALGQTPADVRNWPALVRSLTTEEINAVARRYLQPDHAVTGLLLDAAPEEAS